MDVSPGPDWEQMRRAAAGDADAWRHLLARHHGRLRRMVALRLDARLRGRVDPSDVLQETYLEAAKHLPAYLAAPALPAFLWLRYLAAHRLGRVHRRHLGADMRDAARDVSLSRRAGPGMSSVALAEQLLGRDRPPSEAAALAEKQALLRDALDLLDPLDREILALRHFEQLTGPESARVLGISAAAAGKRHIRALARLKGLLAALPGGLGEFAV